MTFNPSLRKVVVLTVPWPLSRQLTLEVGKCEEAVSCSSDTVVVTPLLRVVLTKVATVVGFLGLEAVCPGGSADASWSTSPPVPM